MRLGQQIPDFDTTCEWLNSEPLLIGDKPTCFHFWSISCVLCKQAMPHFINLCIEYKSKVQFISVHTPLSDTDNNLLEINKVVEEQELKVPIAVDHNESISDAFQVTYVPAYYVFDEFGKLRHIQRGKTNLNMLEKNILRMI
ncbi:TlpA family protein disulfide reductase [Virgibacillus dokdonensis]|uniref:Thiol-disulfide oxidoreductase YkuV n=1 Tax=Virgibacillus dokdonensis TaxID=302167 RepID=A0A2K9J4G4_9BACI|nr:TlpA disulfide reductase family protein [Virgibacillus dokdonensis]AUJ26838.1 Thiol-disulfide oxidoreductase YkuV [Virgibacillus dokdonensis]